MPRRKSKPSSGPSVEARRVKAAAPQANSKQAEELMDLAVDAARSRHLPDFLKRFAARAASLANADWGGVVVFEENAAEFYSGTELTEVPSSPTREWLVCKSLEINGDAQGCILPQGKRSTRVYVPILSSSQER